MPGWKPPSGKQEAVAQERMEGARRRRKTENESKAVGPSKRQRGPKGPDDLGYSETSEFDEEEERCKRKAEKEKEVGGPSKRRAAGPDNFGYSDSDSEEGEVVQDL